MNRRTWNRKLPEKFDLGGENRFSNPALTQDLTWTVRHSRENPPALVIEPGQKTSPGSFRLFPQYCENPILRINPDEFDQAPELIDFSWDWIEYLYSPLKELEVRTLNWVPDPWVICGENWITNQSNENREVDLDYICLLQSQGGGSLMSLENINGRTVLIGQLEKQILIFFLQGNPTSREGPYPTLGTNLSLPPGEERNIRWICARGDTKQSALEHLEKTIHLKWSGEISRRRIVLSGQLQIDTTNPSWNFALALSQKTGILINHQLLSQGGSKPSDRSNLTAFQAYYLLQCFIPSDPDQVAGILELVFKQFKTGNSNKASVIREVPQLPMGAELLWQVKQSGYKKEFWNKHLALVREELSAWFTVKRDQDMDGIPELTHPDILGLINLDPNNSLTTETSLNTYPYLESPGLAAALYNDLCRWEELAELDQSTSSGIFQSELENLLVYLQSAWNPPRATFQDRDNISHLSVDEFTTQNNLKSGLNILRIDLPQASRIGILFRKEVIGKRPQVLKVILHGIDWKGLYRIEEIPLGNYQREGKNEWKVSESIYSRLDYCLILGFDPGDTVRLISPSTTRENISLMLPLWAKTINEDLAEILIEKNLNNLGKYKAKFGLRSFPDGKESGVQLPWNLLIGQALLKFGKRELAAELINRWMDAVAFNLERSGIFYSIYAAETGRGIGAKNPIEGLIPVVFFLKTLGIQIQQDSILILPGKNPFPGPVTITYQGLTICRETDRTLIDRSGKTRLIIPCTEMQRIPIR